MAPGPDGSLYVSIPVRTGPTVLALLDRSGRPRPGWPIAIKPATSCGTPMPVDDGSVRVVCTLRSTPVGGWFSRMGAFAFDSDGRMLAGWPVELLGYGFTGRVLDDDLVLFAHWPLGEVVEDGQPPSEDGLVTISADGALRKGVRGQMGVTCCGDAWAVGPDGIAYGVGWPDDATSRITAVDFAGGPLSGWPVSIDDIGSVPAFGSGGQIVVTVGNAVRGPSRVSVLSPDGKAVSSGALPIATVERTGDTGGCSVRSPQAPLVSRNGTTFVYSELDTSIYALDPSLAIAPGWPYEPVTTLATARPGYEYEHEAGYCPVPVIPAVGPDGTLYLPLVARSSTVGGSLVAVGADARVVPGWPVGLQRPGAEFWSVVVGSGGAAYALAIEPESGDKSSASILAIAPDSTVRWTTTIIDP